MSVQQMEVQNHERILHHHYIVETWDKIHMTSELLTCLQPVAQVCQQLISQPTQQYISANVLMRACKICNVMIIQTQSIARCQEVERTLGLSLGDEVSQ